MATTQFRSLRSCGTGLRASSTRRAALIVKAFQDGEVAGTSKASVVPPALQPALAFFESTNTKFADVIAPVKNSDLYTKYVQQYAESSVAKESFGWKPIAESINSRAAMIGFLAGAGAEIFGGRSILAQIAGAPQPVVLTILLITAGTIIPIVKGTTGGYLTSLQETYTLPEGWFTEVNERVNGRLAMLGITAMIAIELISGRALL